MKKECAFFDGKLLEYAMDELEAEPELKKKVEEHVSGCADCWKKADGYRRAMRTAAGVMKVDFSDEVWEVQRREIIRRVTHKTDVLRAVREFLGRLLTTRRLAAGFALTLVLAAGAGAGYRYYANARQLHAERTMISKVDMLENMELIERLDFYKKMSQTKALL